MELRVLCGLHRGAALLLEPGVLVLGSDAGADVMLADPGIAAAHARITRQGPQLLVEPLDGAVHDARGRPLAGATEAAAGSVFRLGSAVWIGLFDELAPWLDVLPEAVVPPPDRREPPLPDLQAGGDDGAVAGAAGDEGAGTPALQPLPPGWRGRVEMARRRLHELAARWPLPRSRRWRLAIGFLAGLLVVSAAAAWTALRAMDEDAARALAARRARQGLPAGSGAGTAGGASAPSAEAARASEAAAVVALPLAELQRLFTRQLADRSLLDKLEVVFERNAWRVQGSLDEEERGRLERMVQAFERKYAPPVKVVATIVPWSELLPFRVVQVTSGKGANVVLDSGQRLYVGDSVQAWRLVAVEPGKVVFDGKRRVEVAW